ncbi:helix-turn-helix domain-containing protein [Bifidobacterium felsineum]|nr:helix-turn-helix domain-containing protein [Bifidobacterium felsineum]MBT1163134.1 helix-turn-helix domain-containing protein [Bifidobacterium felsineum]
MASSELTTAQVAEILGIAPRAVRRLQERGELHGRKNKGLLYFSKEQIEAYAKMTQDKRPATPTKHWGTAPKSENDDFQILMNTISAQQQALLKHQLQIIEETEKMLHQQILAYGDLLSHLLPDHQTTAEKTEE